MRVYSWNVYDFNKRIDDAVAFISRSTFDVMCLQEVSPELRKKLRGLPYEQACHIDFKRRHGEYSEERYLVILTPHKIVRIDEVVVSSGFVPAFRTRLFSALMRPFGWSRVGTHGALFADVEVDGQKIHVGSVHVRLSSPKERWKDMECILRHAQSSSFICGDLNTIEAFWLKPLNWILGGTLWEIMPWHSDRKIMEGLFWEHGLKNPLRGASTHKLPGNQLDHILVPSDTAVQDAGIEKESHGSDHFPVFVECAVPMR